MKSATPTAPSSRSSTAPQRVVGRKKEATVSGPTDIYYGRRPRWVDGEHLGVTRYRDLCGAGVSGNPEPGACSRWCNQLNVARAMA
jgi:hypothetical protein